MEEEVQIRIRSAAFQVLLMRWSTKRMSNCNSTLGKFEILERRVLSASAEILK